MTFSFRAATDDELLDPNNWINAQQLADILKIKKQTLYSLLFTQANLPTAYRRRGTNVITFFRPEVVAFLRSNEAMERRIPGTPSPRKLVGGAAARVAKRDARLAAEATA